MVTGGSHFGDVFGLEPKFSLRAQLGAGGFAEVYKAIRKEDGLTVALKVPRLAGFQTAQPDAFLKEADHWKNLRHPGIVRLIEFGQTPIPYIAMEYMPGGSLRSRIGSLSLPEALAIAGQLAEALFYAHRHGLVHLDIKPENVLFDGAGNARLSDFGLSRVMLASVSGAAQSLSTAFYSAPEQFVPGREYGIRDWQTDIWQFGATLYEMVTGQLPFPAQDMMELMHKILHEEPAPLSQAKPGLRAGPELERLILHCLKKHKKDRFDDFHPVRNQIRAIVPASDAWSGAPATEPDWHPAAAAEDYDPRYRREHPAAAGAIPLQEITPFPDEAIWEETDAPSVKKVTLVRENAPGVFSKAWRTPFWAIIILPLAAYGLFWTWPNREAWQLAAAVPACIIILAALRRRWSSRLAFSAVSVLGIAGVAGVTQWLPYRWDRWAAYLALAAITYMTVRPVLRRR